MLTVLEELKQFWLKIVEKEVTKDSCILSLYFWLPKEYVMDKPLYQLERLPDDEVDVSSLRSALERRVSVDTVATEPWLRPGTSDAVKRSGCKETPNSRMEAPPWLTHRVT